MNIIKGKSPRLHVWIWLIGSWIISFMLDSLVTKVSPISVQLTAIFLLSAVPICCVIVTIRRLNDLDKKWWWVFGLFVPIFNVALLLGLLFRETPPEAPYWENDADRNIENLEN